MNRDNQQQTATDLEIGWLAGFLEGEGSICLQIHRRKDRSQTLRVTPKVILTNSDSEMIEAAIDILTKIGVGKWVHHTRQNNRKASELMAQNNGKPVKFKDVTYIHISGMKRVKRLLDRIGPAILGEKKERHIRLLKFINDRLVKSEETGKSMNYKYDKDDVQNMLSFLELTNSPNVQKISRMLNDYTGSGH